jgi:hypothetical protein
MSTLKTVFGVFIKHLSPIISPEISEPDGSHGRKLSFKEIEIVSHHQTSM